MRTCLFIPNASDSLPVGGAIVFQELAPDVVAGVEAVDDGVEDAGGAVDGVERRGEALLGSRACGASV